MMSYTYYQEPCTVASPTSSPYYTPPNSIIHPQHHHHHQLLHINNSHTSYGEPEDTTTIYSPEYHIHTLFPRASSLSVTAMNPAIPSIDTPLSAELQPRDSRRATLYKTELCRSWEETGGHCKYGEKCQFAHGLDELRHVERHPRYKTEMCRTFWEKGSCPYGKRCCFIHTEKDSDLKLSSIDRRYMVLRDPRPRTPQLTSPISKSASSIRPGVQSVAHVMSSPGRSNSTGKTQVPSMSDACRLMRAGSTGHDALTSVDIQMLKRMSADSIMLPTRRQSAISLRSFTDSEYSDLQQLISTESQLSNAGQYCSSFMNGKDVKPPSSTRFSTELKDVKASSCHANNSNMAMKEMEASLANLGIGSVKFSPASSASSSTSSPSSVFSSGNGNVALPTPASTPSPGRVVLPVTNTYDGKEYHGAGGVNNSSASSTPSSFPLLPRDETIREHTSLYDANLPLYDNRPVSVRHRSITAQSNANLANSGCNESINPLVSPSRRSDTHSMGRHRANLHSFIAMDSSELMNNSYKKSSAESFIDEPTAVEKDRRLRVFQFI